MNENIKAGADIHAGDGGYEESTHEKYEAFAKVRNQSLTKARIRQFEKESGLEIYGLGARRDKWEHCMEKFTKLVVEECLNQCYNRGMNDEDYAGQLKAAYYIKQHFGVEE